MLDLSKIPVDIAVKFYRNPQNRTFFQRIFHQTSAAVSTFLVKLFLLRHSFKVVNYDTFINLVVNRPIYQPLITVSNHHSCLDDIILTGASLPFSVVLDADKLRWTLTAVDICFTNCLYSTFFASGKGIPVWRRIRDLKTKEILSPGLGVDQPSMNFCVDLLNNGRWIHIFSQGRVVLPEERQNETNFRLKWGIGRLIADSKIDPIVLPIWHCNFDSINPTQPPYVKHTLSRLLGSKQCLTVTIGDPMKLRKLKKKLHYLHDGSPDVRHHVHAGLTSAIQKALYDLKPFAEAEHRRHKHSEGVSV